MTFSHFSALSLKKTTAFFGLVFIPLRPKGFGVVHYQSNESMFVVSESSPATTILVFARHRCTPYFVRQMALVLFNMSLIIRYVSVVDRIASSCIALG